MRAPVRARQLRVVTVAVACAFVVVLWGGYDRDWGWTGFQPDAKLWDWLHVFVLPLAVVAAPLWLRYRDQLGRRRRLLLTIPIVCFAVLVAAGYAFDLGWTGFPGNELWDWLELLLLPLAIGLMPVWVELAGGLQRRHVALATAAAAFLLVAIVGGYHDHWHWTGFRGNTLFDWMELFIAPLVLPFVLVPVVEATMTPAATEAAALPSPAQPPPVEPTTETDVATADAERLR